MLNKGWHKNKFFYTYIGVDTLVDVGGGGCGYCVGEPN